MTEKRFTIKEFSTLDAMYSLDVICDKGIELPSSTACDLLNELSDENKQLREHFIYLIGTALEDKECRKIYAKGLLEIFDDCANLDEAKIKIKEYLE